MMESLLNLVFPTANICHLCERALEGNQDCLCGRCTRGLEQCRISPMERSELVDRRWTALSAFWYQDQARRLVHQLKFNGDLQAARPLGDQMTLVLAEAAWISQIDCLVPVPVHPLRLRQRGYNQAQVLAQQVGGHTGLPLCLDVLFRPREQGSQISRSRQERLLAMKAAFSAKSAEGKHILLVDDVLTTGATAAACARALQAAGAAEVRILTACRA